LLAAALLAGPVVATAVLAVLTVDIDIAIDGRLRAS
jgi:hypothetical protein